MSRKSLGALAAVTLLVVVVGAFLVREQPTGIPSRGQPVLPDLMERINEVHGFTVETADQRATVVRDGTRWVVKEKKGYPAAMDKVRPFLIGLAELTILEPTTSDPAQYAKLGVEDATAEGSSSTLVTLHESDGVTMASLVIGSRRAARGGESGDEIYVRKPDESRSWLAVGRIRAEAAPGAWIDRAILDLDPRRVRRVRVTHPDGERITIHKQAGKADFALAGLPDDAKVQSQFAVNQIAESVTRLTLDDVLPASEAPPVPARATEVVLETLDGLRIPLRLWEREGSHYATVSAGFDARLLEDAVAGLPAGAEEAVSPDEPGPGLRSREAVEREAEHLQRALDGWVFAIPAFSAEAVAKRRSDLVASSGAAAARLLLSVTAPSLPEQEVSHGGERCRVPLFPPY